MWRITWWRFGGHAKVFAGPGTQVHLFAPFAAEGPVGVARRVDAVTTAARAGDDACSGRCTVAFWMSHPRCPKVFVFVQSLSGVRDAKALSSAQGQLKCGIFWACMQTGIVL